MITNTTYRILVEKLGDSDPADFVGNEGELFYDPSSPSLSLSDGSTIGGLGVVGGGGGGAQGAQGVQGVAATLGALNYSQTIGAKVTVSSSASFPVGIVTTTITTNGNPVQIVVTGDAENTSANAWGRMQLYRDTTPIGNNIQFESSATSENSPYSLSVIDTPAAGTYSYSLKVVNLAGGNFNFGESTGPVLYAYELANVIGTQGAQGAQGVQGLSNQGAQGVQGLSNQGVQGLSNQGVQGLSNQGVQGLSNQGVQGTQGISAAESGWTQTVDDTYTTKQVIIGNNTTTFSENLVVEGNARVTGILSVGTATIVLDPSQNTIAIGTAITLNADLNTIEIGGSVIGDSSGSASYVGVVTAASLVIGEEPVSGTDIDNWNTAYGWGNHADAGYLTSSGAGTSTGDVTFSGNQVIGFGTGSGDGGGFSTLELVPDSNLYENDQYIIVDPTGPDHIHLRAGGTQDNSSAELFLGGEKNHVSILDGDEGGVRLYNEERFSNTSYYSDGTHFTSATWVSDGSGGGWVEFTTTDPDLINGTFNAGAVEIATVEQGTVQLVYTGATNLGNDVYRISSQSAPSPDPQTVTNINITVYTTYQNEAYLREGDFRVEVRDDVRIIGGDNVSLRNNSQTEPVTIIANNDNNSKTWEFKPNGTLEFPDNTIQVTGITSEKTDNWDTAYDWGNHSTSGYITATSTSYAQTLIVDPNGDDINGTGGPNDPFQTPQAAHDYAATNNLASEQVVVRLNTGSYGGNLLVTRPNTHFVGPTQGVSKSTRISGIVTVSTASSVGGFASDMVSFENMLIVSSSGTSAVTIGGTFGCSVMFKDAYVFTGSSTAKCVDVTNTAASGVSIHMKNTQLQNQSSSGTTLNLSNTNYANLDLVTLFSGTGTSMNITTTDAVVYNTRIEKTGIGTAIIANSSFTAGKPSLILGNATIVNPTANSDGILVPSGSTVNIAQVAFNIAGTGFAVKGSAGSVVVHGNNLFVPGTTNKISSGIGAGNIPLTTAFTAA